MPALADIPLVLLLLGLAAYAVLAGADFGAGVWLALAARSPHRERLREHALRAMAAVWEANHVWLIFVLVIAWTAYPTAFASIASTLCVPLFLAAVGIIMRGSTYVLRIEAGDAAARRLLDVLFAASSALTPFMLGAAVGGIASGRVPVGNAAGSLVRSWVNPTSLIVGALAVVTASYLAAVYLAADATRLRRPELEAWFRGRALVAGVIAGAMAVAGLLVVRSDATLVWAGMHRTSAQLAVAVSAAAGLVTLLLVARRRYEPARASAALAVAAIVAGWALAQRPTLLPGLTVDQAAAPRSTLVAVVVVALIGAAILTPSLATLYGLVLRGRFDIERPAAVAPAAAPAPGWIPGRSLLTVAAGCLVVGMAVLVIGDAAWTRVVGLAALVAFMVCGFVAIVSPSGVLGDDADQRG